jgi:type II secretory pathway predicted ATPase ExeA
MWWGLRLIRTAPTKIIRRGTSGAARSGKPRTVNNICTAAMIVTASASKNLVDRTSARTAIAEVTATD